MEQQKKIISIADLRQVRVLGRTTGKDVINLFWTGSGIEFLYTGSELWLEVNADYDTMEPWLAVELNGAQISRFPVNKGKNEVCLFRGMTVGKPKHVRNSEGSTLCTRTRCTEYRFWDCNMEMGNFWFCRILNIAWNL